MRRAALAALVPVLVLGVAGMARAANTDSHTVTVTVTAINEVAVFGGNIILTISSATAGSDPNDATDTTCDLRWTTNESSKKITVQTNLVSPTFTLRVLAQNVSGSGTPGTPAAEVTLSTTPTDFITAISTTAATCDLRYRASATAAQGTGSDVHTVTWTLTS